MLKLQLGILFLFGYLAIIFEHVVRVNKAAVSLFMAGLMWLLCFSYAGHGHDISLHDLSDIAQIIFFLLSVMVIIELVDAHRGFAVIARLCRVQSKTVLLWVLLTIAFFMSAALDNLTSIIIIASIIKRLVPSREDRLLLGSMCVIAVNAGGAWTPLGDVTTTMLWINGKISSWGIIRALLIPSASCAIVAGLLAQWRLSSKRSQALEISESEVLRLSSGSYTVVLTGLISLLMIPIWKASLGVPPFLGALLGLGSVWVISDWTHYPHGEERQHLRVPHILTKIDISSITFFIGILLSVSALSFAGILNDIAYNLDRVFSRNVIAVLIGLVSSVLDNVPLVAATMNMYDLPIDHTLWQLIAYTAGTGGSVFIIGSAAGVAFMGLEKVDFVWYVRKISGIALVSYFVGVMTYFAMQYFGMT